MAHSATSILAKVYGLPEEQEKINDTLKKIKEQNKETMEIFGNLTFLNWKNFALTFSTFDKDVLGKMNMPPFQSTIQTNFQDAGFGFYINFPPQLRLTNLAETISTTSDPLKYPMDTFAFSETGDIKFTFVPPVILESIFLRLHNQNSKTPITKLNGRIVGMHNNITIFTVDVHLNVFSSWKQYLVDSPYFIDTLIIPEGLDIDNVRLKTSLFGLLLI